MTAARAVLVPGRESRWGGVMAAGLLGAAVAIYLAVVGIVSVFNARPLVAGIVSLGQAAVLLPLLAAGYVGALRAPPRAAQRRLGPVLGGAAAGAIAGAGLAVFVLVSPILSLRTFFLYASAETFSVVTFGLGAAGAWVPVVLGLVLGAIAGAVSVLPPRVRRSLAVGLVALVTLGLFAGLLRTPMLANGLTAPLARFLFAPEGLTPVGAVITVALVVGGDLLLRRLALRRRIRELPVERQRALLSPGILIALVIVALLPQGLGPFFAQVVALVALYILMGLGLNITLGLAGLLDLGFVAFFAVGAYTVGLLTSTAEFGIAQWPWWAAVPVGVVAAMLFGGLLGLPILGIRGDYLAIATLGFGEIIRILAGSNLMLPVLGGPRGIINIPKPLDVPPDHFLAGAQQIYYIALACAALIAFVAWRLRDSRIGRAWVAIREDEDVAEAMGVNLVQTKLLAYMLGAAFAGLGGAVFAALVGSIFPSSINLFVSINVAALIIVGGMGSIPGVIVGAIFLIGLPELFREFSEYRFLFYGIALILMMRFRPEGLLPSRIVRRELHVPENVEPGDAPAGSRATAHAARAEGS